MDSDHQPRIVTPRTINRIFSTIKWLLIPLVLITYLAISIWKNGAPNIFVLDGITVVGILFHLFHINFAQNDEIDGVPIDTGIQNDQTLSIQIENGVQLQPQMAERIENGERSQQFMNTAVAARVMASLLVLPPTIIFESTEGRDESTETNDECAVCLEDFKNGEWVQPFPKCNHMFHSTCINTWLLGGKSTCPKCRFSLQDLGV